MVGIIFFNKSARTLIPVKVLGSSVPVSASIIEDADGVDEDEFVQIADQNETGRNFAAVTFKAVEKQIVDAYDMLADEEDKDVFYDYLLTNMMLYFDKFEDELQADLPDVTTDEYDAEQEKDEDTEASSDEFDLDSELEI